MAPLALNLIYNVPDRSHFQLFSSTFHRSLATVRKAGNIEDNLSGLFYPRDIDVLETFRRTLHHDILWCQRFPWHDADNTGRSCRASFEERGMVNEFALLLFDAIVRVEEAQNQTGQARRLQLLTFRLQVEDYKDKECDICTQQYGGTRTSPAEGGKLVVPRRLAIILLFLQDTSYLFY